jgi:MOSC domain-containing protein YiiM
VSESPPGTVLHIFVARRRGAPMEARREVRALLDGGLEGDRYADGAIRKKPEQQVTFIESEHIEAFARETALPLSPDMPRRNLVTVGVRLNELRGRRFLIGEVRFEGLDLCEPCRLFASRSHREVLAWFAGKGGLRARILAGGAIRVGDEFRAES